MVQLNDSTPRVPSVFFFLRDRRPPRSTLDLSSASSDVYKRQEQGVCDYVLKPAERERLQVTTQRIRQRLALRDALRGDPVSYTHLRTHETVLDLVCRLLLEKQKDIVPIKNQPITKLRTNGSERCRMT